VAAQAQDNNTSPKSGNAIARRKKKHFLIIDSYLYRTGATQNRQVK
jgi:hypothetical protein